MRRNIYNPTKNRWAERTAANATLLSDKLIAADRLGFQTYNPRHVPTLIGPIYILGTHVIIDDTRADEYGMLDGRHLDPQASWFNEHIEWVNGVPK